MDTNKYDYLKLENQLCFPLYACSKEVIKLYKPHLDKVGLTYTQYITMMVMWEHKELFVKELGAYLYLDSGTLTPVLKKLEEKGFVERITSANDARDKIIRLTKKGEALKDKATEVPQNVGACINLGEKKSMQLYNLLYELLDALK